MNPKNNFRKFKDEIIHAEACLQHEEWVCEKITAWLDENPRREAVTVFTAGPLRNLARKIEKILK